MLSTVQSAFDELLAPGEPVLAGISGGPDSVALLQLLVRLGWRPHVCHLDHGWRGADSEADAAFVRDLAGQWELPATIERGTLPDQTEDAARTARFAFFESVAIRTGISKIVLGHTADDQVETFLLRLIRGAGVPGLVGIWPDRKIGGLRVVRPLLGVSRDEVIAYLRANQLSWREDSSNQDSRFLRNRVRHELIPLLEQNYNPGIRDVLRRSADILRDEDYYLLHHVAKQYYLRACRDDTVTVSVLCAQPAAIQRRLIRFWLGGENEQAGLRYSYDHIEAVRRLAGGDNPGASVTLPGELVVYREYDRLCKQVTEPDDSGSTAGAVASEWPLAPDAVTEIPDLGLAFQLTPATAAAANSAPAGNPARETFDADVLGDRLIVRTWRPGDRFQPLGMAGAKKLQDFFVDAKIPRRQRRRTPLLCSANGAIAWVVGHRISDPVKVTARTARRVTITAAPLPD